MTKPNSALQAGGDETPVAWMRKGTLPEHGSMHNFRLDNPSHENWLPLFTRPTPAAAAGVMQRALHALVAMQMEARARNCGLKCCDDSIEELRAVLSAGAPAVPLLDSVHSIADDGQAPSAGLTSQPVSGNTAASTEVDAPPSDDGEEWEQAARDVLANPRPIEEIRRDIAELRARIQCDGRDGVTDSGASSEAREATSASNEQDGNADCPAALRALPHQPTGERE